MASITLAGSPDFPKQPQLPASAAARPSFTPACTIAMRRITQKSPSVAMAMRRPQFESRIARAMKTSAPITVRSDHSKNAFASTLVLSTTHLSSAMIGGGSRRGLNSHAFMKAPKPIQPAQAT